MGSSLFFCAENVDWHALPNILEADPLDHHTCWIAVSPYSLTGL